MKASSTLRNFIIAAGALSPALLFAQDADAPPAEPKSMFTQIFSDGGPFMWVLILLSIIMVTLIIFNLLQLSKKKFAPADLEGAMMDHMQACRVRSAIEVAAGSPTYLGRMMATALPFVDATDAESLGRESVEDSMAEFTVKENRGYLSWIGYLAVIAQVAPMLGLLGTVSGMVKAFAALATTGAADPGLLAGNISEALFTTMGGLIVAIPSIIGFYVCKNKLNKLVAGCHQSASDMLDASVAAVNADQQLAKVPEGLQG